MITIRTTIAALVAATLLGAAASPAMANGQISFGYAPSDPGEAEVLGLGLQVFSLVKGFSGNGLEAYQNGSGNSAGGSQHGGGNHGVIYQEGNGHTGTIEQNGYGNSCGLFQFGNATDAHCMQNGYGQSGITTVFGF